MCFNVNYYYIIIIYDDMEFYKFGLCLSRYSKWVFCMDTVLETYFRFGFPNESSVGDSIRPLFSSKKFCKIFQISRHIKSLDTCMKY